MPGSTRTTPCANLRGLLLALLVIVGNSSVVSAASWKIDAPATVYAVATSANGEITVTGRRDNLVTGYDSSGQELWSFATGGTVYGVDISDDGQRVGVASEDRHVYLLDGAGQEIWNYRGSQTFLSVSVSGDGQVIAAGSEDRTVTLFDAAGQPQWQYTGGDHITNVEIYGGASGFRVVAGSRDSRVTLLDGSGALLWQITLGYSVRSLAVTSNGATIVAGDDRETLYSLNGGNGEVVWSTSLGEAVTGLDISTDGSVITAGGRQGIVATFAPDGAKTSESGTGTGVTGLALTADGTLAAIAFGQRAGLFERGEGGALDLPEPDSFFTKYRWYMLAAILIAVMVLALTGFSKHGDERRWRAIARRQRSLGRDMWRARLSYFFLIPTVTLLLVFNYYPAFSGIYHAFTNWSPGTETTWVGLKQFRDLADNHYFWVGIGNLVILIVTGFLKLIVPLAVAEMIFHIRSSKIGYTMRTLFVLQVIVPGVVGILLWVNVYDPNIGLANQVLDALGLGGWTQYWLGDANTAIWAIVFMGFPWVSAFALLIFYGGLISIPAELFDSAQLDGASTWRRILNIDLPLLLAQFRLLIILAFIATVQEFAAIFLTTGGGPGSSTYVPSLELYYQAVRFNNFGAASAIGAVLFIVILGGTILNLRYVKSSVEYGV